MLCKGLNIILDIDDTIASFVDGFEEYYNVNFIELSSNEISQKVELLKKNTKFWKGLKLKYKLDFEPRAYCTARINSKYSTKCWIKNNNLPNKPVYQVKGYNISKVPQLKRIKVMEGEFKLFIDDSWKNVQDAIQAGIPALLLDTPYNRNINSKLRINDLKFKTIYNAYKRIYF